MSPKTKAILKTTGAIVAGAALYAYLPLVSFAFFPEVTGWLHMGLAAIHPLLGEALLGGGVLYGVGKAIKNTWATYFKEKKLEKKVEQIVEEKMAHQQDKSKTQENQKEQTKEISHDNSVDPSNNKKEITQSEEVEKNVKNPQPAKLARHTWKFLRKRQRDENQKKAA